MDNDHILTIYINKNELEQENIDEKNIKIKINDSQKENNNSLIKIQNNKSLIIAIED